MKLKDYMTCHCRYFYCSADERYKFPMFVEMNCCNEVLMNETQAGNSPKLQTAPHIHCSTILLMF
jgi:hypothetical protein